MTTMLSTRPRPPLTVPEYREIMDLPKLPPEYLDRIIPSPGTHSSREVGLCVMEIAAWIAGEPHTDGPECVCPTINRVLVAWNDTIRNPQNRKALMNNLVPVVIGTTQGPEAAMERHYFALNRVITHQLPVWLREAGLHSQAYALSKAAPAPPPNHPDHTRGLSELLEAVYDVDSQLLAHPGYASKPDFIIGHYLNPDEDDEIYAYDETAIAGTRCLLRYDNQPPHEDPDDPNTCTVNIDPYPEIVEIALTASTMASNYMKQQLRIDVEKVLEKRDRIIQYLQHDTAQTVRAMAAIGR